METFALFLIIDIHPIAMSEFINQFTNVLVVFSSSTVMSLALEWLFGPYHKVTTPMDIWLQFFNGMVQFFVYVVATPQLVTMIAPTSIYGAPGMTASLCFFWGFLFMTNMRAKVIDWYSLAVDPSIYMPTVTTPCSSGTCPQ